MVTSRVNCRPRDIWAELSTGQHRDMNAAGVIPAPAVSLWDWPTQQGRQAARQRDPLSLSTNQVSRVCYKLYSRRQCPRPIRTRPRPQRPCNCVNSRSKRGQRGSGGAKRVNIALENARNIWMPPGPCETDCSACEKQKLFH